MSADWSRLSRGHVTYLIRLLGVLSIVFAVAGLLLLLAPQSQAPALGDVAQAASRRLVDHTFLFPKYSELTSKRTTPFEFQALEQTTAALRQKEPEPQAASPPPATPPAPTPDVAGLILVGTAPGAALQRAVLRDEQNMQTTQIALGDKIRNSVVKAIRADKIVLALGEQEAELTLTPVQGSDNLSRQLKGLPPLTAEQPPPGTPSPETALPGTRSPGMPSPGLISQSSGQPTGNAVLVGAAPGTGGMPTTMPGGMPGAMPGAMPGDMPSSPPSGPNAPVGQSGNVFNQDQPPSPTPPPPPSNRSLGISGYMLSLEKQQELGLSETGLVVTALREGGSPLQIDDVILAIAGQTFTTLAEARQLIQSVPEQAVQVRVHRNGAATEFSVPLK